MVCDLSSIRFLKMISWKRFLDTLINRLIVLALAADSNDHDFNLCSNLFHFHFALYFDIFFLKVY